MGSIATHPVTDDGIYLGFWINWSYGRVRGATLTLGAREGGLFAAFLALFVGIAGTSFWRIACFVIHHMLSSEGARDGIYHQRQAILRNATGITHGLWHLVQMNVAWRNCNKARPWQRVLPLITFAFITLVVFVLATIFSSRISTSMGNEVLLDGRNCGVMTIDGMDPNDYWRIFLPNANQRVVSSANYAQECYVNNTMARNCPTFLRPSLPWTVERDVACPLPGQDKICRSNSTNLRLDTGYLDSNRDLGINSAPDNRFLYRTVVECAPLKTEGYAENVTVYPRGNGTGSRQVMRYYYGHRNDQGIELESPQTFQYSADQPLEILRYDGGGDYNIKAEWAYSQLNDSLADTISTFKPIPDLKIPAADTILVFLAANDIEFLEPTDDSWYSAHQLSPPKKGASSRQNVTRYIRDDPVRVLGCSSRYQYCNPNLEPNDRCTPLHGIVSTSTLAKGLWRTEKQKALFNWSANAILYNAVGIPEVILSLGVSALTSRYKLTGASQGPLPDNQWQLEVEHWFTTMLASLQRALVEAATGPTGPEMSRLEQHSQKPAEQSLCRNQKIRSDAFTSFSTLGLALLLGIGGTLIVTLLTLEFTTAWVQKRWKVDAYKRLEWSTHGTLQLQRLAHEEIGCGTWTKGAQDVPITGPGDQLALLDISNPEHPRLVTPARNFVHTEDHKDDRCENGNVVHIEELSATPSPLDARSLD